MQRVLGTARVWSGILKEQCVCGLLNIITLTYHALLASVRFEGARHHVRACEVPQQGASTFPWYEGHAVRSLGILPANAHWFQHRWHPSGNQGSPYCFIGCMMACKPSSAPSAAEAVCALPAHLRTTYALVFLHEIRTQAQADRNA